MHQTPRGRSDHTSQCDAHQSSDGAGNRRLNDKLLKNDGFFAPRDFLIPISRVRSVTDTSMMFITPTPATRREIPAIPPSAADIMDMVDSMDFNISLMELI